MSAVRTLLFALILAGLVGLGACAGRPAGMVAKSNPPEGAVAPPDSGEEVALTIPREEAEPSSAELPEPRASEESVEVYAGPPADQPAIGGEPATRGERGIRGQARALPLPSAPVAPSRKPAEVKKKASPPAESAPKAPPIAASPPKAGSAAPQIAGSAAAAAATTETRPPGPGREVLARKGDTVVIDLEGRGWLLLPGNSPGVSFTGSEAGTDRTTFSFRALIIGTLSMSADLGLSALSSWMYIIMWCVYNLLKKFSIFCSLVGIF